MTTIPATIKCPDCNVDGEIRGIQCICPECGKVIGIIGRIETSQRYPLGKFVPDNPFTENELCCTQSRESFTPRKTLEKMINIAIEKRAKSVGTIHGQTRTSLASKLLEMRNFIDNDKFNRWFGYYQRVGEEMWLWTLEDIIAWVREERQERAKEESEEADKQEKHDETIRRLITNE
jgi:hypothetical protein